MHELAIAQGIIEKVDETAAGRKVRRVIVEIGRDSCVSAEALAFSFDLVAEGSAAHGAVLDVRSVMGTTLNVKSMEVEEVA
jgi:hydrogenase nickel incorporation protein HypA/HybF